MSSEKTFKPSKLYRYIAERQKDSPWGTMLDAGTGLNSIRWMAQLPTKSWTAVTGSKSEANRVGEVIAAQQRSKDRILLGNWADPNFLSGETYDTVLADYLMGAIEGYAPYFQPYLFERLRPLTRNALYVTGLEPYVPTALPNDEGEQIIWEIGRLRDACVLLSGDLPYREYPAGWVVDQLRRSSFTVQDVRHFKIGYKESFVNAQIDVALYAIGKLIDHSLAESLKRQCIDLRDRALQLVEANGALRGCRNYVISAKPN